MYYHTIRLQSIPPAGLTARSRIRTTAVAVPSQSLRLETDNLGLKRVAYEESGWDSWKWRGLNVNYIAHGSSGPSVLLIHGFGASAYQWRYNIPDLAQNHRVFALDLIGFGKSDKLVMDYSGGNVWSDQIADFIREFIGPEGAYVAGNSLGGFAAVATAARSPELIKGIIGLNVAGTFSQEPDIMPSANDQEGDTLLVKWRKRLGEMLRRVVITYSFFATRSRVRKILLAVYHDKNNVDDDLVRSIEEPALDPKALDVYCKLIQGTMSKSATLDSLLKCVNAPMLLLWGMKDPWITPKKAERFLAVYQNAEFVPLEAGHCVHDECPRVVNDAMTSWIERIES